MQGSYCRGLHSGPIESALSEHLLGTGTVAGGAHGIQEEVYCL